MSHQTRRRRKARLKINDKHHLLYTRRSWNFGYAHALRNYYYCIITIRRDTLHHLIHTEIPYIPAPKEVNAMCALEQLKILTEQNAISQKDNIRKRLEVLASLFDAVEQPTADALRAQLSVVHRFYNDSP